MAGYAREHTCPRCGGRTSMPDCCGIVFAKRRRWRMSKLLVRRVHAIALGQKGLDEETYKLRLRAVGVESSKDFTRTQYQAFMKGLAKLPDVQRRRVGAQSMARGRAA